MQQRQQDDIGGIRGPSHTNNGRGDIVLIGALLGDQQPDDKGPGIGDEGTGGGMKTRGHGEIVQAESKEEAYKGKGSPGKAKGQPKDEKEIEIRSDEAMQGRHLEKDEYLYQDKQDKTDNIFQQLAHCIFLRVESSNLFCSSY